MKRFAALLIAAVVLAALFAGCSSSKKVKVIDIKLTDEEYAFGVAKNQPDLLTKVNEFIAKIKGDGTFDAICDKYFEGGTPEEWYPPSWIPQRPACSRHKRGV